MKKKPSFSTVIGDDILGLNDIADNVQKKYKEMPSDITSDAKETSRQIRADEAMPEVDHKNMERSAAGDLNKLLVLRNKSETKSTKKTFRLKPSISEHAAKKAESMGISLNDVVNQLLLIWIDEQ